LLGGIATPVDRRIPRIRLWSPIRDRESEAEHLLWERGKHPRKAVDQSHASHPGNQRSREVTGIAKYSGCIKKRKEGEEENGE